MKILKNFLAFVFIVGVLGYTGQSIYKYYLGPCSETLEYRIGRFDSNFSLTKEQFKNYITEAEKPWETALGKNLFSYNSEAKFTVNLIYDERQRTTELKQKTEFGLTKIEEVFQKLDSDFNHTKAVYDARTATYKEAVRVFEARQAEYERQVKFWNTKNGAPKSEYESLRQEQMALNSEASRLNIEANTINNLTQELNNLLEERNRAAAEYNQTARDYNEQYGHGLEFNQAEYTRDDINVYQFESGKDLVLALSHEFGHALGMDHIENPKSIMYYVTGSGSANIPTPSAEDLAELKKVCKI